MESLYRRHRFPPEIISHAVWLYHRFTLSFRDVEDLLAERGITVSYEAIRSWCRKFGSEYARTLRRRQGRLGDIWHVDELFITIRGKRRYLWRAVDQDGDVLDILVTRHRDKRAAKRFFRKMLKHQERPPLQLVTDKLRSYPAAHREVFPSVTHRTGQYENNRAEVSHQHSREQERQMPSIQVCGSGPTISLGPRPNSQPVPSGTSSSQSDPQSTPERASFHGLEDGNLCLLKERNLGRSPRQNRLRVVNLTMPLVTIMDFGLAQLTDRSKLTQGPTALGTVSYMSPEQAQGMELDHRTDLWALGAVIYEMVTGQRAFQGHYDQAITYSIQHEEPELRTAERN